MLNKREIWEICKKLLNMISDSMLHFFAVYILATGFNTLYCIQYDIRVDMEIVKYYHEYTLLMASLVWILVCLIFMYNMETAKVFTSLALYSLQMFLLVVQKSHTFWLSFFLPNTIVIYVIIFLIIRGLTRGLTHTRLTKLEDLEHAEKENNTKDEKKEETI